MRKRIAWILTLLLLLCSFPVKGEETDELSDIPLFSDGTDQEPMESPEPEPVQDMGGISYSGGSYSEKSQKEELIRQPKILFKSSTLSGVDVEAGSELPFQVIFQNKSPNQSAYNLKITLSSGSDKVRLKQNSFYISKVNPGGEIVLDNQAVIGKDMEERSAEISFQLEYEDKKANQVSGSEKLILSVVQPVRVELEPVKIPSVMFASDTVEIPVSAINLSRTPVYNVRIRLSGKGLFPGSEVFLGNLEAGTKGEDTMRIYVGTRTMKEIGLEEGASDAEKYGQVKGKIILTYEDYQGNVSRLKQKFTTEIKKAEILSLEVEDEEEANSWWISVFCVVILGLVAVVLLLALRLRRKNVLLEEARKEGQYGRHV